MEKSTENNHIIGYGTYILVWLTLVILSGLTVSVAGIHLGEYAIIIAMVIAAVKSILVLMIFMHLKFEDKIFRYFVGVAFLALLIFIVLLFFDYYNVR